jgi:SPP1 family predicted phage head-tail adaptor|nr:MAG TPA: head closure knob [Caudoviricetes sp.]
MYWRELGYLCREIEKTDSLGKPYKEFEKQEVFCNEKGVKRNEFYQAQAQGYRPELCIEIKALDYNKEGHFEYDGTMYRIIRTYPVKNECLELICQALVADD